mmetsp:Transcript_22448/g.69508  ORF Transcript_22448/g.69508 Transcript_22448/m.69508 type:complete len:531 (+) Transcript_22448:367-1959(+)
MPPQPPPFKASPLLLPGVPEASSFSDVFATLWQLLADALEWLLASMSAPAAGPLAASSFVKERDGFRDLNNANLNKQKRAGRWRRFVPPFLRFGRRQQTGPAAHPSRYLKTNPYVKRWRNAAAAVLRSALFWRRQMDRLGEEGFWAAEAALARQVDELGRLRSRVAALTECPVPVEFYYAQNVLADLTAQAAALVGPRPRQPVTPRRRVPLKAVEFCATPSSRAKAMEFTGVTPSSRVKAVEYSATPSSRPSAAVAEAMPHGCAQRLLRFGRAYAPGCWSETDHSRIRAVRTRLSATGLHDAEIMRFLEASPKGDNDAAAALTEAVAHREQLRSVGKLSPGDETCSQLFWLGGGKARSSSGCPVLVLRTYGELDCSATQSSANYDERLKACVFQRIEWGRKHLGVGIATPASLLIDTSPPDGGCDAATQHGSIASLLKLLPLLPVHLPGVVDEALVGPVGRWTEMAWAGLRRTMDRDLSSRVRLVVGERLPEVIAESLGPAKAYIPQRLGGDHEAPHFGTACCAAVGHKA